MFARRRSSWTAGRVFALGLALALPATRAEAGARRPEPLGDEPGCRHYRGEPIGGNDVSQVFELVVCPGPEPGSVRATVQTSSLVSGWSSRASTGSWDAAGERLSLRETEFIESRPEPGWRFCLIDAITLDKTPTGLSGSYLSKACNDEARLELELLRPPTPEAPKTTPETTPAATPADSEDEGAAASPELRPEPKPDRKQRAGCSCGSAPPDPSPAALGLVLLALAARARRRRS